MSSIVAPGIDAEIEYRREQITKTFRRTQLPRQRRMARAVTAPKVKLTARPA